MRQREEKITEVGAFLTLWHDNLHESFSTKGGAEMYTLDLLEIPKFELAQAAKFVDFWSDFYRESTKISGSDELIDYLAELNIGNELTQENIRRLLRWKDRTNLSDPIKTKGPESKAIPNPKVTRVIENLPAINEFRMDQRTESEMWSFTEGIFPSGFVWRVFLLHIAKPHVYPIGDDNVLRSHCVQTRQRIRRPSEYDWEYYESYRQHFNDIAGALGIQRIQQNIDKLKKIDDALLVFGQFLLSYYPPAQPKTKRARPKSSRAAAAQ
jgi:hypothetical protein